jgi:uncharacterized membrane protein YeiB
MFIDLWIVCLFSLLFGACAYINYNRGIEKGVEDTLAVLQREKIIVINGEDILPYNKEVV